MYKSSENSIVSPFFMAFDKNSVLVLVVVFVYSVCKVAEKKIHSRKKNKAVDGVPKEEGFQLFMTSHGADCQNSVLAGTEHCSERCGKEQGKRMDFLHS